MNAQKTLTRSQKRNIFFGVMIIVPIIIFILFYGVINANSIIMAFKKYEPSEGSAFGYKVSFAAFHNFKVVIEMLAYKDNWMMLRNSVVLWAAKLFIGLPVSVIFSYYVYKKAVGSRFFRIILFLPNIISNLIMVYLFRYFANNAIAAAFNLKFGLLDNPETTFITILFFNLWLGFAGQTLMLTSSMASINESIVESAQIDGVTSLKELFYITIPMIFPTISVFIVSSIAQAFMNQMNVFNMYGQGAADINIYTIGYYLYTNILGRKEIFVNVHRFMKT